LTDQPQDELAPNDRTGQPALSVTDVRKRYGATIALGDVNLDIRAGEIHCLLGENGAGKSTLVKIIAGLELQDAGTVLIGGREIGPGGVRAARAAGVGVVYQHPVVFPDIDVTENIYAGRQIRFGDGRWPIVDTRSMRRSVRALFGRLGVKIDPASKMSDLTTGERQLVEIAKALSEEIQILILDEPTAALPDWEVSSLFSIIRRLAESGVAILFISHRLDEIFEIGDRVTVLRDGRKVATEPVGKVTKDVLITMMVGRQLGGDVQQERRLGEPALEVIDWRRRGIFAGVSFSVRRGEVLGFAGLVGSGGADVARTLFGIEKSDRGEMRIGGKCTVPHSPRQMMSQGMAFVPEDRQGSGLIGQWEVFRNVTLPILNRLSSLRSFPRRTAETEVADHYVEALDIRPKRIGETVRNLSGGNQQKVLLSKWLATNPSILILEEPTAGIDIGAKNEVHRLIDQLAREGMALIVVSSDLSELLSVTHRVLVFSEGRVTANLPASEASRESIMRAATDYRSPAAAASGRAS
jgi:rhamnose transport system ATP-binding protein